MFVSLSVCGGGGVCVRVWVSESECKGWKKRKQHINTSTSTHQYQQIILNKSTHQYINTPSQSSHPHISHHITTSTHQHQHINTSTHQHMNRSTHQHNHQRIIHQHINTSIQHNHQPINTSTHQHINTSPSTQRDSKYQIRRPPNSCEWDIIWAVQGRIFVCWRLEWFLGWKPPLYCWHATFIRTRWWNEFSFKARFSCFKSVHMHTPSHTHHQRLPQNQTTTEPDQHRTRPPQTADHRPQTSDHRTTTTDRPQTDHGPHTDHDHRWHVHVRVHMQPVKQCLHILIHNSK